MKYRKVTIEAMGYELAPVVVTSTELEARLEPLYRYLRIAPGQLQALTGIRERRWWEPDARLSAGATSAARKALAQTARGQDVGTTLKVTPQIIFGTDEVILKIDLVSSLRADPE